MKLIPNILIVSFFFSIHMYGSSHYYRNLSMDVWAAMTEITLNYNQGIIDFKEGKNVNFEKIFQSMESFKERLTKDNQKHYSSLIQERRNQINILRNTR